MAFVCFSANWTWIMNFFRGLTVYQMWSMQIQVSLKMHFSLSLTSNDHHNLSRFETCCINIGSTCVCETLGKFTTFFPILRIFIHIYVPKAELKWYVCMYFSHGVTNYTQTLYSNFPVEISKCFSSTMISTHIFANK